MSHVSYALITGASSGIGRALAFELASHGHPLILVARREAMLRELEEALHLRYGTKTQVFTADLSVQEGAQKLYQQVSDAGLCVGILVNNAGRGNAGMFAEQAADEMHATIELNVQSLTTLTRLFLPSMQARGTGKILNLASVAGFLPGPGFAVYHATKAFVLSLSEALNTELRGSGVSVTASCPGPTESEFHEKANTFKLKHFDLVAMMSAEKVAAQAYEAMMRGDSFVVHGMMNRMLSSSPKLLPRRWVPGIVGRIMRWEG